MIVFPQGGNTKSFLVADEKTGEIFWKEAIREEMWIKGWLDFPTVALVLHLNFVNMMNGIVMDTKLVILRSSQDVISLEVDSNRFVFGNSGVGTGFILGILFNLAQMIMTCFYIRIDRENAIAIQASQDQEDNDD